MRLSCHEQPKRRQYLRSKPHPRVSHCSGCVLWHMWWHVGIHTGRIPVPRSSIDRANSPPPAGFHVAASLSPTVDVHLDPRGLEFPVAPALSTSFYCFWCSSWWNPLWEARCRHGCICSVRRPSPYWHVGDGERVGVRHCWGILPSHGHRCGHGGSVFEGDRVAGPRVDWLVMDDAMGGTVGYIHDRWLGSTWCVCY